MTPGDAYWVGAARPRKPAHTPLVVVSHRTIVNNNLPVSYLCTQPEVPSGGSRRRRAVAAMALRRTALPHQHAVAAARAGTFRSATGGQRDR